MVPISDEKEPNAATAKKLPRIASVLAGQADTSPSCQTTLLPAVSCGAPGSGERRTEALASATPGETRSLP